MDENTNIEVTETQHVNVEASAPVVLNETEAPVDAKDVPSVDVTTEDEEIIDIEIDAAFPGTYYDGTMIAHMHPISEIDSLGTRLNNVDTDINNLKTVKQVYSTQNGLAEFRKWEDGNQDAEDRSGYFVSIVPGTEKVKIYDGNEDIYGVTIARTEAGFVGGQDENDKSDDFSYAVVGIIGAMRVRHYGSARIGDYIVPSVVGGDAVKSDVEYGFKVMSTGSYSSYPYVVITFAPQGGMSGGNGSGGGSGSTEDIDKIIVELKGKTETALNNSKDAIDISDMTQKEIDSIVGEIKGAYGTSTSTTEEAIRELINTVEKASGDAATAVQSAEELKTDAVDAANTAIQEAQAAAQLANNLSKTMEPIVSWTGEDETESGVAGFVAQANEDHVTLASIVSSSDENGTSISAIMQRTDENGAMIQHLVSHVDRYSVGSRSISDGMTYEEAQSILTDTHIYVCTNAHTETMKDADPETIEFIKDGDTYSYIWNPVDVKWTKGKAVSTSTSYVDGNSVGDLWLCFEDVEVKDANYEVVEVYIGGTLYRWFGSEWVAVATIDGSEKSRMLTSVKQTADDIKMVVNNYYGENGSTFQQNLKGIFTTVQSSDDYISAIEQTATDISAGTYSPDGTGSALELFVADTYDGVRKNTAGLTAVSYGKFHVVYQSLIGDAPDVYENCNKYSQPPVWDEEKGIFVFNESHVDNENGAYYFHSGDQTKYCNVTEDGYDIYVIGNQVTSLIDSRITETEATLSGVVEIQTEQSDAFAGIVETVNANSAKIESITSYSSDTLLLISKEEVPVYGENKYNKQPEWDASSGKYVFGTADRDANGVYYLADEQGSTYCKVVTTGDGQTLYEIYGLVGHYMSSITQGADEDGGYIQSMVLDIERYNVGQYSPSYGMSYDDATEVIPVGTAYVPTVDHSENLMRDSVTDIGEADGAVLSAGTLEERENGAEVVALDSPPLQVLDVDGMQTYDFEVTEEGTHEYTWNGTDWEQGSSVSRSTEYFEPSTDGDPTLWYCTQAVVHEQQTESGSKDVVYEAGTLYTWRDGNWYAIATTSDSLLSRSISLVRQTADSYSVRISNIQGEVSEYKQTVEGISLTVSGLEDNVGILGENVGQLSVTSDEIKGEVKAANGNIALLRSQADSKQASMDLMVSGYYHKLDETITDSTLTPYNNGTKYSARPEWSTTLGRFVFYEEHIDNENGTYFFFDSSSQHYCKVVGDTYEVYVRGTLSEAKTDANITEDYAVINTLANYGDDETSTLAVLRNLALEGKAQVELLASLDRSKLVRIVDSIGYKPEGQRYSQKPTYNIDTGVYVFDDKYADNDGSYFLLNAGTQFGKLIYSNSGICLGYEVYKYDGDNTAGLIATVLENQASVGLVVQDGAVKAGVIVEAINDTSNVQIKADRINLETINTRIEATENAIKSEVAARTEANQTISSKIEQTATEIRAEINSKIGELGGQDGSISSVVMQEVNRIDARVTEVQDGVTTNSAAITLNKNAISAEVTARENEDTAIRALIQTKADEITASVQSSLTTEKTHRENEDAELAQTIEKLAQITITSDNIKQTVEEAFSSGDNDLSQRIASLETTASGITATVTSKVEELVPEVIGDSVSGVVDEAVTEATKTLTDNVSMLQQTATAITGRVETVETIYTNLNGNYDTLLKQVNRMSEIMVTEDAVTSTVSKAVTDATGELQNQVGQLEIKYNEIDMSIFDGDHIVSQINTSSEGVTIYGKKIQITGENGIHLEGYTTVNKGFSIDENGNMAAIGGTFSGSIYGAKIYWGDDDAWGGLLRTNGSIRYPDGTTSPTSLVHIWTNEGMFIQATDGGIRMEASNGIYFDMQASNIQFRPTGYEGDTGKKWVTLAEYIESNGGGSSVAVFG